MRETTFILMQSTSLRGVRFIVEKQISEHFMETLYDLTIKTDEDEIDQLWSRCWEHWKLNVDALDLKTNFLINFSSMKSSISENYKKKAKAGLYNSVWTDSIEDFQVRSST